jgi:hypothetical protein
MIFIKFKNATVLLLILAFSPDSFSQKTSEQCEAEVDLATTPIIARMRVEKCVRESVSDESKPLIQSEKDKENGKSSKIFVSEFGIEKVNSAGGVELFAMIVNANKSSAIKYLDIQATLYNAVGDTIPSEFGRGPTRTIRFTGPLKYDDENVYSHWGPIWYNSTGSCVKIQAISVEFMDRKKRSFVGASVFEAIGFKVKPDCKPQ